MGLSYRKSLLRDITDIKRIINKDLSDSSETFLTKYIDSEINYIISSSVSPNIENQLFTIEYDSNIIGFVHFYGFNKLESSVKLGYYLDINYRGKGLLIDVCTELIDTIFKNGSIKKIVSIISSNNKSSIRFIKKLNFQLEKRIFTFNITNFLLGRTLRLYSLSK